MNYSRFDAPQQPLRRRDVSGIGDRRLSGHVTPQSLYITTIFSLLTLVTLFLIKCNKGNKNKEGEKRKVIREFIKGFFPPLYTSCHHGSAGRKGGAL